MLVELGNRHPTKTDNRPAVCTVRIPPDATYVVADSAAALANEVAAARGRAVGGVTRLPDQEALLIVAAAWDAESHAPPAWVWSDNDDFAVLLGHYFDCPVGRPADLEDTHFTVSGPPGVGPAVPVSEELEAIE